MQNDRKSARWYATAGILALSILCGYLIVFSMHVFIRADSRTATKIRNFATELDIPCTILSAGPGNTIVVLANYERMGVLQKIRLLVTQNTDIRRQAGIMEGDAYVGVKPFDTASLADVAPGRRGYIKFRVNADGHFEALAITLDAVFPPINTP